MESTSTLQIAVIYLVAVVIAVPLAKRAGVGAVLGYLGAGLLLGPQGLHLFTQTEQSSHLAEFGVVMLLFVIGLELSPQRLWVMRRTVFGSGSLQVVLSALLIGAAAMLFGLDWKLSLVLGLGLALSSTAIDLQILSERKEVSSPHGRLGFAILLFQDVAAIPILALVPLLGDNQPNAAPDPFAALRVIGLIAVVVIGGRLLLRPFFRAVARAKSLETFTASALLVVIGISWVMQLAGISMSLGAFLAGMLLADSEFRHELEAQIDPFKGLLLGLFFVSVGMSVDLSLILREPWLIGGLLLALFAIKAIVLFLVGRHSGKLDKDHSLQLAALLAQGGEFGFVVFSLAEGDGLLSAELHNLLVVVITLSMAATPLVVMGLSNLLSKRPAAPEQPFDEIDNENPRVIIAGFGRVGQIVARILRAQHISFTALEHSAEQVEFSRRFGSTIYFGDPSRPELLRAARADKAEVFVLTTDDAETSIRTARLVKRIYPHLKIYVRARNRQHVFKLMDLSMDGIVRETFHSSLVLTQQVLVGLGLTPEIAAERVETFRKHDEELLKTQYLVFDDEAALMQNAKDALVDLERLFEADKS
ncbi:glutathione-regulated potassium-efflux system protein KefB [Pseudolysobacter antarcticus]|uniref:Glutathione-regulated potassium-efflux system protein KefB n=1 Tax=Pseudolysobacter antarcticus TaxID=2511995 RepID=A0A411HP21_9GAMM|nr:monovalent cation:proton antiporter-2 (CPA2) family protein [Pseudolysobacter antarcticus]QBB72249.1 glutathione-regulated potassium-efflux system protein KefB [Pseudolysobacter antarcticus]